MNLDWRMIKALNHLAVFEVAVDQGSFTSAAEKLSTTQPSVSRHIAALEALLDVQLFSRLHHRVELTEAGAELYDAVKLGLDHIRQAVSRISVNQTSNAVSIGCTYGFAHLWLMPRFSAMQKLIPNRELRMVTSDTRTIFNLNEVDFALRFGNGNWPDGESVKLFGELLFPVCSPQYAQDNFGGYENISPSYLASSTLIHEKEDEQSWLTWQEWLGHHNVEYTPAKDTYYFDNYAMTLQAAMDGQGVALAWLHLAEPPLAAGQLVELKGMRVSTDSAYHLAFRKGHPLGKTVAHWFKEMASTQEKETLV